MYFMPHSMYVRGEEGDGDVPAVHLHVVVVDRSPLDEVVRAL